MPKPDFKLIQNDIPFCDVVEISDENNKTVPLETILSLQSDAEFFLITRLQPTLDNAHHAIRNVQTNEQRKILIEWTHGLSDDTEGSSFTFVEPP
jgi:hypothetical protein